MQINQLLKVVKNFSLDLNKDFEQYTATEVGKGVFTESKFEQVEIEGESQDVEEEDAGSKKRTEDDGEFYLQQQEPEVQTIKTYQFNSGMFAPAKLPQSLKKIQSPPQISLQIQQFFGYNSKEKQSCIIIDQNHYCVAIGTNLIISAIGSFKNQGYKIFKEHEYQVCGMEYRGQSGKEGLLVSWSKGLKPEVVAWRVQFKKYNLQTNKLSQQQQDYLQSKQTSKTASKSKFLSPTLTFINKIRLPRKSQGISSVKFLTDQKVLCLDSISMHRSNSIYFFDIQAGGQYRTPKKFPGKIYGFVTRMQASIKQKQIKEQQTVQQVKQVMYLIGDKGVYRMRNFVENQGQLEVQFFDLLDKKQQKNSQYSSISLLKDKIIVGNRNGSIKILDSQLKMLSKISQFHKGWVYQLNTFSIIPTKPGSMSTVIITAGTEDKQVKINKLVQTEVEISSKQKKQLSFNLQTIDCLQFDSYCTSVSFQSGWFIFGLRNGEIMGYDLKNKTKKNIKVSKISCLQRQLQPFITYNKISERLIFMGTKDILLQQKIQRDYPNNKNNYNSICLEVKFSKIPKCIWVYKDKIINVIYKSHNKYIVQIKELADIMKGYDNAQTLNQIQIQIKCQDNKNQDSSSSNQQNKQKQKKKKNLKQKGKYKPKIVRFDQQYIAIGTKKGILIIHNIKKDRTLICDQKQKHSQAIEDIIFQQPLTSTSASKSEKFYIKTVSTSQLFYWQIDFQAEAPSIKKINKAAPVKNLTWKFLCKYSWQNKNIWQQLTHYQDATEFVIVGQKLICAAMSNGTLRVYRHLATRSNFVQWKLFTGKFRIFTYEKQGQSEGIGNYLICQRNCQILLIKFGPLQD